MGELLRRWVGIAMVVLGTVALGVSVAELVYALRGPVYGANIGAGIASMGLVAEIVAISVGVFLLRKERTADVLLMIIPVGGLALMFSFASGLLLWAGIVEERARH